jgi:hypothetical protein
VSQALKLETESLARLVTRRRIRAANVAVIKEGRRPPAANLDANIKKNSTFANKLKTLSEENKDRLLKEMNTLKLEKYVQECVVGLLDCVSGGRLKSVNDIVAVGEVGQSLCECNAFSLSN